MALAPDGLELIHEGHVRPEWIDYNGHMNVAYFVLAFDHAVDQLWARLGFDDAYRERTGCSTFAVESHVTYQRELREGERMQFSLQLLGYDDKRVHQFYRMFHADSGELAATTEWMSLHVSLETRRVVPMSEAPLGVLERLFEAHRAHPWPEEAGRRIRLPKISAAPQAGGAQR